MLTPDKPAEEAVLQLWYWPGLTNDSMIKDFQNIDLNALQNIFNNSQLILGSKPVIKNVSNEVITFLVRSRPK